jgi:Protein of unknown function (DUF3631).
MSSEEINEAKRNGATSIGDKASVQPRPLGELLAAVCEVLRRYVVFQFPEQARVIALWIAQTWVLDAFDYAAYLHVHSAEKRSGKSRCLDVLALLVKEPWRVAGVSLAALFRKVELIKPTLLWDEVDTLFAYSKHDDTKDIQGFLNAGFERGAKFSRCVGQNANLNVQDFEPFCPKALSGIGKVLPDTTADRCIPIELRRQSREEKVERFRKREAEALVATIRAELEAWSKQPGLIDMLRDARPELPEELTDRQQDICEPLLAIVDLAGGEWPEKARAAVVTLCVQEEDASIGVKLLVALRDIFHATGKDKLTTREILEALVVIEDGPWALMFEDSLKHDRLQTAASKLARILKEHKIKPRTVKLADETTAKGYHRRDFEAAWKRYLPTSSPLSGEAVTAVTDERKMVTATTQVPATIQKAVTQLSPREKAKGDEVTTVTTNLDGGKKDLRSLSKEEVEEVEDDESWIVYPGGWFRKTKMPCAPNSPKCELCGETVVAPYFSHMRCDSVRCEDCQSVLWMEDGYEVLHGFPWGRWPQPCITDPPDVKHDAGRFAKAISEVQGDQYVPLATQEILSAG